MTPHSQAGWFMRHGRHVVVAWLLSLLIAGGVVAFHPGARVETELSGAPGTEAHRVATLLTERFGQKLGSSADIVAEGPLDVAALERGLTARFPLARVTELKSRRPHRQRLIHLEFDPALPIPDAQALTPAIRAHLAALERASPGTRLALTGAVAFQHDAKAASKRDSRRSEGFSLLISLVVLVFTFGAPLAALLPLAVGATTLLHDRAIVALLGLPTNPVATILGALVGLALAIDYAIFMVSRFREERGAGRSPEDALAATLAHPSRTIRYSALIMLMSLGALILPDVSLSRTVVVHLLLVIALSLGLALGLLPALLAAGHGWLDRPRGLARFIGRVETERLWRALAAHVVARPLRYFLLSTGLLAAIAWPALGMRLFEPVQAIAPRDAESMRAYRALEADGWGGELMPVQLAVLAKPGERVTDPAALGDVYELTRALAAHPAVGEVVSLTAWNPRFGKADYAAFYALTRTVGLGDAGGLARLADPEGRVALVLAYPRDLMDLKDTNAILDFARGYARAHPGREVLTGGVVARVQDYTHELYRHAGWVAAMVVGGIFAMLFAYMRSAVLPLKAAVMNFLPIAAAYGVLTMVFQHGVGSGLLGTPVNGAVTNVVPIVLFCVVFGLSMDYEVLILSRITEAYRETGDTRQAIVEGLAKSGSLITGAALILLGVFVTGVGSSSPQTQEICLGLSTAIAIDATIVRFLLVPSFMALLGRWNWWHPFARPESRKALCREPL